MPANGGGETMSKQALPAERLRALLKAFKERYAGEYHLTRLGYFGSYARNEATPDSDVDVVFQTDHPDLFLTAMLKQDLEAWLDRPVDVIRLREVMNSRLKARIEREAIYV
jgi:hypothetical protein